MLSFSRSAGDGIRWRNHQSGVCWELHRRARSPAYTASKWALLGFSKAIADKWAQDGIRVNCVAPGFVDTQIIDWARTDTALSPHLLRQVPARRVGRPEEVATTILFLAAPDAAYIVGEAVVIDGGYLLR